MGERSDQGFEVVPTRIGGSGGPSRRGRRRSAPIIIVVVIALLIPAIAWIGPRIEWRPEIDLSFLRPTPTPVPSETPRPVFSPTPGLATPLPVITVGVGPHPTEPFPVDVGGLRLADPATGELGPPLGLRGDTDAIFTSPDGDGWWCVCFARAQGPDRETVTVEVRSVDRAGRVKQRVTVGEYLSVAPPPSQDFYIRFDLEIAPDARTAYLSSATRSGDQWAIAIESIDLATFKVAGRTQLGVVAVPPIPGPTPGPGEGVNENYLAGPTMRLSPDGRRLLVWSWMDTSSTSGSSEPTAPQGWLIDLDSGTSDGSLGQVSPVDRALVVRLRTCAWVAWTTNDELAAICWPFDGSSSIVTLSVLGSDGTERRRTNLFDVGNTWLTDPVLDRSGRAVYLWQPADHALWRADLDSGKVDELKVDPAATGPGRSGSGGGGTASGPVPDWATFSSDFRLWYGPQLLAEPGGRRLFALGVLPDQTNGFTNASSGVWVFDAPGLSLLDRWPAAAAYWSVGLSADGRWLTAAGAPGADVDGHQTSWEASITIYDTSDGRPVLQLGRLGTDMQVLQVPP